MRLFSIDTKENLQAAGICFFFGILIWLSGAYLIAVAAIVSAVAILLLPPIFRRLNDGDAREGPSEPLRWHQSVLMLPVVIGLMYALFYGASVGIDFYQCYQSGGAYSLPEGMCR